MVQHCGGPMCPILRLQFEIHEHAASVASEDVPHCTKHQTSLLFGCNYSYYDETNRIITSNRSASYTIIIQQQVIHPMNDRAMVRSYAASNNRPTPLKISTVTKFQIDHAKSFLIDDDNQQLQFNEWISAISISTYKSYIAYYKQYTTSSKHNKLNSHDT